MTSKINIYDSILIGLAFLSFASSNFIWLASIVFLMALVKVIHYVKATPEDKATIKAQYTSRYFILYVIITFAIIVSTYVYFLTYP